MRVGVRAKAAIRSDDRRDELLVVGGFSTGPSIEYFCAGTYLAGVSARAHLPQAPLIVGPLAVTT